MHIPAPLGLPELEYPHDNTPTYDSIQLGRALFYDRRLSRNNVVSCSSCHDATKAYTDGRTVPTGVAGAEGVRNAPTLLNTAYLPFQFWDGRSRTLEEQVARPIKDHREMDQNYAVLLLRVNADPRYRMLARRAFGSSILTMDRLEKAIASFERTLLSGDSPFDRYYYGRDKSRLTQEQIRGLRVFQDPSRGNCTACHKIEDSYALFTDGKFHNIGIGVRDDGSFADPGRYAQTGVVSDTGAFLTPTLRNVALTPPYMHDGSEKTLREVVDFYAGHGNSNPYLDPEMLKIHLSSQDRKDLSKFLEALTGTMPPEAGPQ